MVELDEVGDPFDAVARQKLMAYYQRTFGAEPTEFPGDMIIRV